MNVLAVMVESSAGDRVGEIAATFGVDWPHLVAQVISFSIVCTLLYWLAYKPVLQMLEERRKQIGRQAHDAAAREHTRMMSELRREVGQLVVKTTAAVTGKILSADDQRRLAEETARQLT